MISKRIVSRLLVDRGVLALDIRPINLFRPILRYNVFDLTETDSSPHFRVAVTALVISASEDDVGVDAAARRRSSCPG
jgi:hypothetical protein